MISPTQDIDVREILRRYSAREGAVYHDGTGGDQFCSNRCPPRRSPVQTVPGGFSGARIWRVETAVGPCALRSTPASQVDLARLAGLHRLLAHVGTAGMMQVPVPLTALDGTTFFEMRGQVWQLEPWMPGAADFWTNPDSARLSAAMICLARWHVAAARFQPHESECAWFFSNPAGRSPGLAERARKIARRNGPECDALRHKLASCAWKEFAEMGRSILDHFVRLAPRVESQLKFGLEAVVPLQPCLRDIWHDHVLFTGNEVTGLIDAHASRSDCVATDLARLLGSLVRDDRARWDAGLAAYQTVRPLALSELALVALFDQSAVLLGGMTWLDWVCLEGRTFDDREKVLERLRKIVARLEMLAGK